MIRVTVLPAAELDMLEQVEFYDGEGGNAALGDRFVAACEAGFARLSSFPESGAPVRLQHPKIQGIRFIPVPDFHDILILYQIRDGAVRIVRVLHGKRDIQAILRQESTPEI
ncbi:hypothetical protein F183_A45530 [Bryobacterales bacterium F-183]|nr:hypothetical protein F183_A45530 [Bryobacterales bacterium F-183]